MKALIQRVKQAEVSIDGQSHGKIDRGILTLLGVEENDSAKEVEWLLQKIISLRIFPDDQGKMNHSLADLGLSHLVVSQFTLLGDVRKGRRPHFLNAGDPKRAKELFCDFVRMSQDKGITTEQGVFAADMEVSLINDGPVTFMIDTPESL